MELCDLGDAGDLVLHFHFAFTRLRPSVARNLSEKCLKSFLRQLFLCFPAIAPQVTDFAEMPFPHRSCSVATTLSVSPFIRGLTLATTP